jgi:hypothetical protein
MKTKMQVWKRLQNPRPRNSLNRETRETREKFIGSDNNGLEQARGAFWNMVTWDVMYGGWYTNGWPALSNSLAAWQSTLGGGGFGGMMTMGMMGMMGMGADMGTLNEAGNSQDTNYNTDYTDYTNFWLGLTTSGGQAVISIQNALSNLTYVILTSSVLDPNLADWGTNQTILASNSDIAFQPFNPGPGALFFDAALAWSTTTNGLPDWWQMKYFGNLLQPTNGCFDGDGTPDLQKYLNGADPNVITFQISFTNQYVNMAAVPLSLGILGGVPYNWAVLLDNTNFSGASWTPYTSSNITANMGTNQGRHIGPNIPPASTAPACHDSRMT